MRRPSRVTVEKLKASLEPSATPPWSVVSRPLVPMTKPFDPHSRREADGQIRLNRVSDETGCNILAKAEFMSPGGSIKDRAALYLVKDAEEKGLIQPGGTVVEGTAGNTGIGLAHVCRSKGYKCVIYMPDTQSQEKIDLLRILGADVRPVPGEGGEQATPSSMFEAGIGKAKGEPGR